MCAERHCFVVQLDHIALLFDLQQIVRKALFLEPLRFQQPQQILNRKLTTHKKRFSTNVDSNLVLTACRVRLSKIHLVLT